MSQNRSNYNKAKYITYAVLILIFVIIVGVYIILDPATNLFPRCPLRALTGYYCPGCGSQRAIHQLLHFNISSAFTCNPLLVLSIPYIFIVLTLNALKRSSSTTILKLRKFFCGYTAILIILTIIILYWVVRNIFDF